MLCAVLMCYVAVEDMFSLQGIERSQREKNGAVMMGVVFMRSPVMGIIGNVD